jgi:hypothetical protein
MFRASLIQGISQLYTVAPKNHWKMLQHRYLRRHSEPTLDRVLRVRTEKRRWLYVIAAIYCVSSIAWWFLFYRFPSVIVLTLPWFLTAVSPIWPAKSVICAELVAMICPRPKNRA